jgi:hypothetical protein
MARRKRVESEPMFGLEEWPAPLVLPAGLSNRRRQTAEKLQRIALGLHPLNGLPLDPLAPKDADRSKRIVRDHTCGSCVHLYQIPTVNRSALACDIATTERPARKWWPGCDQWKPREVN